MITQLILSDTTFTNIHLTEFYNIDGWFAGKNSKGGVQISEYKSKPAVAFKFSVSSIGVDANFIAIRMDRPMMIGEQFEVKIKVAKDRFSAASLREMQVWFTSSPQNSTSFIHGSSELQLLSFSLEDCRTSEFTDLTMIYTATGGENYLNLGSVYQKFSLSDVTKLGLLAADKSYSELPSNSTYYINRITVKKIDFQDYRESLGKYNTYNIKFNKNWIVNGGGEIPLGRRHFINEIASNSSGTLIAPYVYSLTPFCPNIEQLDSNDYRYSGEVNDLCYMGNSQFFLDALRTNVYHNYQNTMYLDKGSDYYTYYYYENDPPASINRYSNGDYITFVLADSLEKGKKYVFSVMMKMDQYSSFGVGHLGVHLTKEIPTEIKDSLWSRIPDEILSIAPLTRSQAWHEVNLEFVAKGGEKFVTLGHLPELSGVIKNQNFIRDVHSTCGPNEYNCLSRYVYYKDSLFARYQVDNVVLTEYDPADTYWASIYQPGKSIQLEIVFDEILKTEQSEINLQKAKNLLIEAMEVLRNEDAICVVDQEKRDPIILEPYPIINKKKILRKLNRPKGVRKLKIGALPKEVVLFGSTPMEKFTTHLILVIDNNSDLSQLEITLTQYTKGEGNLTILYVGEPNQILPISNFFGKMNNTNIIDLNQSDSHYELVEILLVN